MGTLTTLREMLDSHAQRGERTFLRLTTAAGYSYEGYAEPSNLDDYMGRLVLYLARIYRIEGRGMLQCCHVFDCLHISLTNITGVMDMTSSGISAQSLMQRDPAISGYSDGFHRM